MKTPLWKGRSLLQLYWPFRGVQDCMYINLVWYMRTMQLVYFHTESKFDANIVSLLFNSTLWGRFKVLPITIFHKYQNMYKFCMQYFLTIWMRMKRIFIIFSYRSKWNGPMVKILWGLGFISHLSRTHNRDRWFQQKPVHPNTICMHADLEYCGTNMQWSKCISIVYISMW